MISDTKGSFAPIGTNTFPQKKIPVLEELYHSRKQTVTTTISLFNQSPAGLGIIRGKTERESE